MIFVVLFLVLGTAFAGNFNAPLFEIAEHAKAINLEYSKYVDDLIWNEAFKWANATTGQVNFTHLAEMQANLASYLEGISTSDVRQCERLDTNCYACENGAVNITASSINILAVAKLYGQDVNIGYTYANKTGFTTFFLKFSGITPIFTANLTCRLSPTCFPATRQELIQGWLQGLRRIDFKIGSGLTPLIETINGGGRFIYYSPAEAGVRVIVPTIGPELVPQSVMDSSLTGIFCIFGKNKVKHYSIDDLPIIMNRYLIN